MASAFGNEGPIRPPAGGRPRSYKTDALVLRAYPVRDADRLVTVLTPTLGKLKVTVRGARRMTSRLGGHLDVLNHVHLALAIGHQFDVVTGAESTETFPLVKANLEQLSGALYLMELADLLIPEFSPHPSAYHRLHGTLQALEEGRDAVIIARYGEFALLEDAGYLPELHACVACGQEIEANHHQFSPALGGVVCATCAVAEGSALPLGVNTLKVMRHFAAHPVGEATHLILSGPTLHELGIVLGALVRHVLERQLNSSNFVEHLGRLAASHSGAPKGASN